MLQLVPPSGHVVFTAGDLIDGLAFLDPPWRRAVLFGLEQRLHVEDLITLTYPRLKQITLTDLASAVVRQQPRHIRLSYVFWYELEDGMVAPLVGLERAVRGAFGGWGWSDLRRAYGRMVWIDAELELESFLHTLRQPPRLPSEFT